MKTLGAKIFTFFGYAIATIIIVVAVFVTFSILITPVFNRHKSDIETWISDYTKSPVKIDNIEFSWYGYEPQIVLNQVTVFDKANLKPKLEIRRIRVDIGVWRSLWTLQVQPDNFVLSGVRLSVYENTSGQINVQGILGFNMKDTLTGASVKIDEMYQKILSQPRIALRDIDVLYYPAKGGAKWVTLHDLTLQNSDDHHTLTGGVILRQDIPTKVQINFYWQGDLRDYSTVDAKLYFYVQGVSLAQWFAKKPLGGFQVQDGLATAKVWVDWNKNQWQKIQSTFQLYDVELKSLVAKHTEVIESMRGDIGWKKDGDNMVLAGEQIFIDFPDHLWQSTNFNLNYTMTPDGQFNPIAARIDYLDLDDVKRIALASNVLSDEYRKILAVSNPQGDIYKVNVTFNNGLSFEPTKFTLSLGFSNLGFSGNTSIPSVDNLTGEFSWNGESGDLKLNSHNAQFLINRVFNNPQTIETVTGAVNVQKDNQSTWTFKADQLKLANADLGVTLNMTLVAPANASPTIDLNAQFEAPQLVNIVKYLPMKVFDPDLVKWLKAAFLSGELRSGTAIIKGKLADFPYDQMPGEFRVEANVKNVDLNFAPGWPVLNNTNGTIVFDKSSMLVDINSGTIVGVPFNKARAVIPYLGDKGPQILSVAAEVSANMSQELRLVQESPLRDTLGKDLAGMNLEGPIQLNLDLVVPLKHPEETRVKGVESMTNSTLTIPEWKIVLNQIDGSFIFTEDKILAKNIRGKLLGEPAVINISMVEGSGKHNRVRADVASHISVANLQKMFNIPFSKFLQGDTDFNAELYLASHASTEGTRVVVNTDMVGVAVNAQEPFGKAAQTPRKLQLDLQASARSLSTIKIQYANIMNAGIDLNGNDHTYAVTLENSDLQGKIIVPADFHFTTLQGDFKRCYFKSTPGSLRQLLNPKTMPALNLSCSDLRYGSMSLGSITINAVPNGDGLQIRTLRLSSPYYTLNATGDWQKTYRGSSSHLQGQANSSNVSEFLAELGFNANNLIASTGNINFDLAWPDAPFKPSLNAMTGEVSIKLGKGRIIELSESNNAKMGIGRMLNIFSLSSIPRRLSGDFSDISQNGYSFDSAKGSFSFRNGSAYTQDTQLNGPIASLDISGRIGLAGKDYDITLSVTPYVTASLPVVATLAGGPVVGVATWVMSKVISAGVSKVVTYHYTVRGSWDNPDWNQVGVNPSSRPAKSQ